MWADPACGPKPAGGPNFNSATPGHTGSRDAMNDTSGTGMLRNPPVVGAVALLLCCASMPTLHPTVGEGHQARSVRPVMQLLPGPVRELAAGKLLVAARDLRDPNFSETVILLADFTREGAMGVIINRRTRVPVTRLFPQLKAPEDHPALLYLGGPVAATGVLGLVRSDAARDDSRHVVDDIYLVATREPLESLIAAGVGPSRFRVYLGYAGWGPGQLERETAQGSWHIVQSESDVVFDADPGSLWRRQIRRTDERMARRGAGPPAGGARILPAGEARRER